MRRSWSAVSFGGGIVPSILRAERFGQDASVQRLGGGGGEPAGQCRGDVPGVYPPTGTPPPARWASAAFTLRMIVSGITRTAPGCPMVRERSGNGVTPWSAVSTTTTLFLP